MGFDWVVIALVILVILVLLAGVKTVPQGYNYTVERFGRFTRTLTPGLNLIVPFIDSIGSKMNMMEQVLDVPTQEVITKDNATVSADGVAFYQVLDAARAAYEVRGLENAILQLTMTNLRTVMGGMDLDELLSKRDDINDRLLHVVDAASSAWGIKVTRIEIKDIDPPRDIVESMGRQMKAEREKRAVILDAEGLRQSEILKAEGEKQALILQAEGRREAAFRDAEARERSAEAEAKATEMVSKAIAKGDVQAINYFVAQSYTQAIEKLASAPNQKVLMLPIEAAALIGSLGGIAEIAKDTFSAEAQSRRAERPRADGGRRRRHDPRSRPPARAVELVGLRPDPAGARDRRAGQCLRVVRRRRAAHRRAGAVHRFRLAGRADRLRRAGGGAGPRRAALLRPRAPQPGEQPFLNERAHRLVGSTYMLSAPIVDGHGRCGSTTPTGGSPAPTCRRARG